MTIAELAEAGARHRLEAVAQGGRPRRPRPRSTSTSRPRSPASASLVKSQPLAVWKDYLTLHAITEAAPYLPRKLRRRPLRDVRQDAVRHAADQGALEARASTTSPADATPARRGGRQPLRRQVLHARDQGPRRRAGQEPARSSMGQRLDGADLDERRDQGQGQGQARHLQPQDRLSQEVARLLGAQDRRRRRGRQRAARSPSSSTTAGSPSSASRSIATSGA